MPKFNHLWILIAADENQRATFYASMIALKAVY
jgi:hypothetical protein